MTHAKGIMPLLVAFLVLGWVFMNGGTSLQAATPAPVGNWRIISSPNPSSTENTLLGVATVSAKEVWAVGYYRDSNSNALKALIERWNGSRWKVIVHPAPSATSNFLFNVTAISAHNVWAVGRYTDSNAVQRTLILHWNGTAWRRIASPNASTSFNTLNSVAAISSNNIWAVGYLLNGGSTSLATRTLILHYNGSKWSVIRSPNGGGGSNYLADVTPVPTTATLWSVGYFYDVNHGNPQTLTEFYH